MRFIYYKMNIFNFEILIEIILFKSITIVVVATGERIVHCTDGS